MFVFSLYSRDGLQDSQWDNGEDQDVGDYKYQLWRWAQLKTLVECLSLAEDAESAISFQ